MLPVKILQVIYKFLSNGHSSLCMILDSIDSIKFILILIQNVVILGRMSIVTNTTTIKQKYILELYLHVVHIVPL